MMDLHTNAVICHEQADKLRGLALAEGSQTKRRLLFAVAEQYYLLHDQLMELERYTVSATSPADRPGAN